MTQTHSLNRDVADYRATSGANPAAGADFTQLLPQNAFHQIIQVQFVLTTDANAANRVATVGAGTGAGMRFECMAPAVQTASLGIQYTFCVGIAPIDHITNGVRQTSPLPDWMIVHGGQNLHIDIVNKQAGDQISAILYALRTWYY